MSKVDMVQRIAEDTWCSTARTAEAVDAIHAKNTSSHSQNREAHLKGALLFYEGWTNSNRPFSIQKTGTFCRSSTQKLLPPYGKSWGTICTPEREERGREPVVCMPYAASARLLCVPQLLASRGWGTQCSVAIARDTAIPLAVRAPSGGQGKNLHGFFAPSDGPFAQGRRVRPLPAHGVPDRLRNQELRVALFVQFGAMPLVYVLTGDFG
jgi:hypothetical protein